ncbi:hypothetical protein HCJ19_09025 [Listeria seeligeri]|uniref:hypothetical protein n=3 Tax=Listeria seeligeri TaxID=1640 RepID=UPI0016267468|nr:hypothetical protein [Listeria seeligeri]EIF6131966.1 hypothetical protein [Listeria monocytogenes]MBC1723763.1 hypothetical protein [Listeria seeligeri]MBC1877780.1 hypothetical protein [Listeria seeligeri]MBC1995664.1 hypothetical protein [Listeria seeligeri]MBT0176569.1 hypothetical protein [Listeria seeligeri]
MTVMETMINLEAEAMKAHEAFYSVHAKQYIDTKKTWDKTKKACLDEQAVSIKSLVRTADYLLESMYRQMTKDMNRFLYVYFRNKPFELSEDEIMFCKAFVKIEIKRELERIFQ